jgi:SAM-dependent methyltransferase
MSLTEQATSSVDNEPWQLRMFRRSLKKQQKLRELLNMLGAVPGQRCLLATCGDNNGALNWHFKRHGGYWTWADFEQDSIAQISDLTGDSVVALNHDQPLLPFPDDCFDVVLTIDVHEHLLEPERLNREIVRIVKPGGRVIITTPNGDERKPANRIKHLVGMRPEDYGHVVAGYDVPELEQQLEVVGLTPTASSSYSRFFTEMVELLINFAYVKLLSGRGRMKVEKGQIAPQTEAQLKSVGKSYKLYALAYPLMSGISRLDFLDLSRRGYAVVVAAVKG